MKSSVYMYNSDLFHLIADDLTILLKEIMQEARNLTKAER